MSALLVLLALLGCLAACSRVRGAWRGPALLRAAAGGMVALWLVALPVHAREEVRIGVLAFRSVEQTLERWAPTAAELAQAIPERSFRIVPLDYASLERAVARHEVHFVLTQPEHYVMLRARHGLAAIATLMPLAEGKAVIQFGGVIFTRAERRDIARLSDIAGRDVVAVHDGSLGGFRAQQWTLLKAGVELPRQLRSLRFTGMPHDKVVEEVLAGRGEVGFVRTGVLEAMAREGRIDLAQLRLINPQQRSDFSLRLSTELFPEWPLAAMHDVPEPLVKAVTLALLNIAPESPAARAGQYYGFSPPGDYTPVEAVLLRLRVHPDRLEHFDIQDIVEKYAIAIAVGLAMVLLLAVVIGMRLVSDNRRIGAAAQERALLLGSLGEGVYGVSPDGRCTFINPAALAMLGFEEREIVGHDQHRLFHHRREDGRDYPACDCPVLRTLRDGERRVCEEWFIRRDGKGFPVYLHVTPLRSRDEIVGAVVVFQDISARKRAEAALEVAAVAFETQEAMLITDAQGTILRVNGAFTRVTGYAPEEALGQTPRLLRSGRQDAAFYRAMWDTLRRDGHWQGEVWNRRKSGELYPALLTISAVLDAHGTVRHYVAAIMDVTQRKLAEAQIEHMALYDPLTDLPNRRLLLERLDHALRTSQRSGRPGALLFIDLDNFKTLNDTRGHDVGDALLVQVAQRLQRCVRGGDTVARLGGDEFVVLLEDFNPPLDEAVTQITLSRTIA